MLGWGGITGSIGYFNATANTFVAGSTMRSSDETEFTIIPLTLNGMWRLDQLGAMGIPLVPYGKLGLVYDLWYSDGGNGETSETTDGTASGGKFGWQGAIGLGFVLDSLDRDMARSLAAESGIQHLYLFAEYRTPASAASRTPRFTWETPPGWRASPSRCDPRVSSPGLLGCWPRARRPAGDRVRRHGLPGVFVVAVWVLISSQAALAVPLGLNVAFAFILLWKSAAYWLQNTKQDTKPNTR